MPRYFLNIRDGRFFLEDEEGDDFPNLEAARAEAISIAREIVVETLAPGEPPDGRVIEIADESGDVVGVVRLNAVFRND